MANRAIACGFLLFASCIYGQENPLEQSDSDFNSKGLGLTETLLNFSHQQHLRIAVEYVDRASIDKPIDVSLQNKTVQQALDSILRNSDGYSWQLQHGIFEITNSRASKRAESQLNTVIPLFTIPDGEKTQMTSDSLWWNLQLKLDPKLQGYGGVLPVGADASTVKPAVLHNRTVREILAYIVLNSRAEGWIVAGPPECLGFTPHCGLWLLVESMPSARASARPYELLLLHIRENL